MTDKVQKREIVLGAIQDARIAKKHQIYNLENTNLEYGAIINKNLETILELNNEIAILDESIDEINKVLRPISDVAKTCSKIGRQPGKGTNGRLKDKMQYKEKAIPINIVNYIKGHIMGTWNLQADLINRVATEFGISRSYAKRFTELTVKYLQETKNLQVKKDGVIKSVMIPSVRIEATPDDINAFMENERKRAIELAERR